MKQTFDFWPDRWGEEVPIWIAAHSPISKYNKDKNIDLFKKYEEVGVALLTTGEIILDNEDEVMKGPIIRLKAHKGSFNTPQAFHLLGPAEPNLLPAKVGISLCDMAVKNCKKPIVANIGCLGNKVNNVSLENLKSLLDTGISAFEVALSCPGLDINKNQVVWWEENFQLIEMVRNHSTIPISLKIGYHNVKNIDLKTMIECCKKYNVAQITAIDGVKLICPPKIDTDMSINLPFDDYPALCFSGTHGPWNRFLLYDSIAILKEARDKNDFKFKISAVGGIMSAEHVFEAMTLGADNVQLSSLLFWHGIKAAKNLIDEVKKKIAIFNKNMHDFSIMFDGNAKEGFKKHFGEKYIDKWEEIATVSATDAEKCFKCGVCCDTPCLARNFEDGFPMLNEQLCSGCGWCKNICPVNAIYMKKMEGKN